MRLKVGLVGAGWSAAAQAWAVNALRFSTSSRALPELELLKVLGRTPSKAEEFARRFGFKEWTTREEEFFKNLDVVLIASPNNTHEHYALRALEEGADIVLEKPVAVSLEGAERILRAAEKAGRHGTVCLVSRYTPAAVTVRELVSSGEIGEVLEFRGVIAHAKHAYRDTPFEWRMSREIAGGGVFADLGVHLLDLAEHLTSLKIARLLAKVFTLVEERFDPQTGSTRRVDVEDLGYAVFEYAGRAKGFIEASKVSPGFEEQMRVEIHGDAGGVRFTLVEPHAVYLFKRSTRRVEKISRGYEEAYPDLLWPLPKSFEGWVYSYMLLLKRFFEFLSGHAPDYHPTLREGLRSQQLLDAVYKSSATDAWVSV
ncbi:MAG: Gfo/Idh/MocA family oxidoreductase [Thermofilum sp.]